LAERWPNSFQIRSFSWFCVCHRSVGFAESDVSRSARHV